jgi:hypothetical protein
MSTIMRPSLITAARSMIVLVLVASAWFATARANAADVRGFDSLQAAVAAAGRVRMEYVATIVDTWRELVRAEESLDFTGISRLTAKADEQQVTYDRLVREELALRQQLAVARVTLRH